MITARMQAKVIYDTFIGVGTHDTDDDLKPETFEEPWRTIFLLTERMAPILGSVVSLNDSIHAVTEDDEEEYRRLRSQIYANIEPLTFPTLADIGDNLKPVSWLWEGWIPRGMLSLLGAFPGTGKSYLALDFARMVVSGPTWPDETAVTETGTVVYVEAEGIPQVTNDRAKKMGIDRSKLYLVMAKDDEIFDLTERRWRDHMVDLVTTVNPDLIIIDSLSSISTKGQNSVEDTTKLLMFLVALARFGDCGLLVLHHLRKPSSGSLPQGPVTIHDFRGSGHIIAMARAVLGLGVIQSGKQFSLDGQRRLDVAKTNLGPYPNGLGITLIEDDEHSAFEYGDALPWDAPSQSDTCEDWLINYLEENGATKAKIIVQAAEAEGFSRRGVYRVRKQLGNDIADTHHARHPANEWALPAQIEEDNETEIEE